MLDTGLIHHVGQFLCEVWKIVAGLVLFGALIIYFGTMGGVRLTDDGLGWVMIGAVSLGFVLGVIATIGACSVMCIAAR
jgi:hypothetical protein